MLCSSGEVLYSDDMWNSYKPELTKKYSLYVLGDYMLINGKVRLWHLGYGLSYLDFIADPASVIKKITLAEGSPVDFGNVQINKSKTKFIKLQNTGNTKTTILSGEIIPGDNTAAGEFDLKSTLPTSIDVGVVYNFRAGLNPSTVGSKKATLRLVTDGEPANLEFEIIGVADPLSVFEIAPVDVLSISPNPANSLSVVRFNSKMSAHSNITIYDNLNRKVFENAIEMNEGINEFRLDVSDYSTGMYFLVISINDKNYAGKIIVE
jgi:hypothetical protein